MRFWAVTVLFAALSGASAPDKLPRVVSIDSCADQMVLALADDDQILALSQDSRGVFSYLGARAEKFPQHEGTAEEIFLLDPDIVLATGAGDAALAETLKRLGYRVVSTGLPETLEGAFASLETAGVTLGQEDRAKALIETAGAELESLKETPAAATPGFYVSPSGITTGAGTFLNEVLELGGVKNIIAARGIKGWSQFDLETILTLKPEAMVTSFFDNTEGSANAWRFAAHPVMEEAMAEVQVIDIPSKYLSCPAWFAVEGAALIREKLGAIK